ncbi:glycosyltransferase family A protein [Brevibacterium daeguense]|uniref:4,4'-diaponeurosporenoate glycosyltransferase n=1 Tax=Brevibacterium daeguense TaxID=909936 RepID=A0ABP8EI41_9MICO|nr:glycosyltransferase family 2 protein [Brevibacterium daeguense]
MRGAQDGGPFDGRPDRPLDEAETSLREADVCCSVVVPVRDDADHLARFLDALALQTRAPDEIVVVDNDSSDRSADIARSRGARIVRETQVGIPFAAAAGYDAATGDIVIRADADTLPPRDWIAQLLERLDQDPRAVAVTGSGRFYGLPALFGDVASAVYMGSYLCAAGLALGHLPLFGTNLAFRRIWWNQVKDDVHLDAGVHDDMDLAFRVRAHERVLFAPSIRVGMSPRPLHSNGLVRLGRGIETIRVNWRRKRPWERWSERLGERRLTA